MNGDIIFDSHVLEQLNFFNHLNIPPRTEAVFVGEVD